MSCGVDHRHGSDPALLWLWCRPTGAAQIQPLAWKLPYAVGATLKKKKKRNQKEEKNFNMFTLFKDNFVYIITFLEI